MSKRASEDAPLKSAKRSKMEDEDVESPAPNPRLCPIYMRGIMSFFTREKVEKMRFASRAVSSAVATSAILPHRRHPSLLIGTWPSEQRARVKDGFVTGMGIGGETSGKAFNGIFKFRFCCEELKANLMWNSLYIHPIQEKSEPLAGELIFPSRADNEIIVINLTLSRKKKVALRVENRLGAKTALALLHFLYHAHQNSYFETIFIHFGNFHGVEDGAMNRKVLEALARLSGNGSGSRPPRFKLRGLQLTTARFNPTPLHPTTLTAVSVRVAQQLIAYRSLLWKKEWPEASLMAFIFDSGGKELASNIEVPAEMTSMIDSLVRQFTETHHDLRREAIPKVTIKMTQHRYWDWPNTCPKTDTYKSSNGCRYTYKKRNNHGDKLRFKVTLRCRDGDQGLTEAVIKVL